MKRAINIFNCQGQWAIGLLFLTFAILPACQKRDEHERTDAVTDRAQIPSLDTWDVSTLISDSGITRYRITTPQWQVFDKATPQYWNFPQGVYLEKFDPDFTVDASLEADSAYYNTDDQIWQLFGHVHALNLEGEQFDTPYLEWSQKTEQIYSDSVITITKESSIIHGVGFRSNQEMSKYTILHPTGVIPIKDE